MAVENIKSDLYRDEAAGGAVPDAQYVTGRVKVMTGSVANGAADSAGSTYKIASLPADCLLDELTLFDDENWGFAATKIGTLTDPAALLDTAPITAPVGRKAPVAFGDANHGKELWEILGLSENPGGMIDLYAHAAAGATGAGSLLFQIRYIHR